MTSRRPLHLFQILLLPALLSLATVETGFCSPPVPLDEEAAFCLYHAMSGVPLEDQDIEDLYFALGRPTFSAFKPAEMFTRNLLRAARKRLERQMHAYDSNTLFLRRFHLTAKDMENGFHAPGSGPFDEQMPHPTPFIRAELSQGGARDVRRALRAFLGKRPDAAKKGVTLALYLKADAAVRSPETRNIALEDVLIPTGRVIFRPFKLGVSPTGLPEQVIFSGDKP
jgi:hypothetical protein